MSISTSKWGVPKGYLKKNAGSSCIYWVLLEERRGEERREEESHPLDNNE
jgi:hypothetical protein